MLTGLHFKYSLQFLLIFININMYINNDYITISMEYSYFISNEFKFLPVNDTHKNLSIKVTLK